MADRSRLLEQIDAVQGAVPALAGLRDLVGALGQARQADFGPLQPGDLAALVEAAVAPVERAAARLSLRDPD
jgi:hypothetical protein